MRLELRHYRLPLKHRFAISRESYDTQDTLIVSLSQSGQTGYGETTSNPYYNATISSLNAEIEAVRDEIENHDFSNPVIFEEFLSTFKLSNFARCALDMASHDLYGKLQNKALYEIWGTDISTYPITNYTIGLAPIEEMVAKMKEVPWPIYKIKLGTKNDLEIVRALREQSDATFRIDANCAWNVEETIDNSKILKDLGVEFIEQPLPAEAWGEMVLVREKSELPVMADESCLVESDVDKCHGVYDGINIKLTKCGGISPALRMIKKARALGIKVMMGCMTESTVGISAIAQFLPQLDYVDMDGAMLLADDIASGVEIGPDGKVKFPGIAGTGVNLIK